MRGLSFLSWLSVYVLDIFPLSGYNNGAGQPGCESGPAMPSQSLARCNGLTQKGRLTMTARPWALYTGRKEQTMKMITKAIEQLMDRFPLYSQDGKGEAAKVLFKVFNPYGSHSWYVLEAGPEEDGDRELFVLSTALGETEYGYMMLSDLTDTRVRVFGHMMPLERDLSFSGTVADALRDARVA